MLNKLFKFVRRIIFSTFLLYGYNLIISPLNMVLPINLVTVFAITIFGIPAFISFIFVYLIVF